jgi:putative RNA 2'-phosphotransferase
MSIPDFGTSAEARGSIAGAEVHVAEFAQELASADEPLVRILAFLLRHGGPAHGVHVDRDGWARLPDVQRALRSRCRRLRGAGVSRIEDFVRLRQEGRFEVRWGKIRALYGHTLPGVVAAQPAKAPTRLLHGTSADAEPGIRRDGLCPMLRGYVHLTSDLGYAVQVARAAGATWVVLRVRCAEAERAGVGFLATAGHVWLSGAIAPEFLDPIPVARG